MMERKIRIYPSILSADFSRLEEEIATVERAGADGLHLDVMDGHFVPNITFGPPVVKSIRKTTRLPFWAHLMIEQPGRHLEAFRDAGVQGITIHCEIQEDWVALADRIHELGLEAGVALNPDTGVDRVAGVLDRFDRILVMTVHPGFGGQSFMPGPVRKISEIRNLTASWPNPPLISVDGGIDASTGPTVVAAGATVLVAGSAIFHREDPAGELRTLRSRCRKAAIARGR